MTSGIYSIIFGGTLLYIGKSNDIERRWKEHTIKFRKGEAAKLLQDAYDTYGISKFNILLECHSDHIDLMESLFIWENWDKGLLNTTKPPELSEECINILLGNRSLLQLSTAEHIKCLNSLKEDLERRNDIIQQKDGQYNNLLNKNIYVKELLEKVKDLEFDVELQTQIAKDLVDRPWFDRLFNIR